MGKIRFGMVCAFVNVILIQRRADIWNVVSVSNMAYLWEGLYSGAEYSRRFTVVLFFPVRDRDFNFVGICRH
jgi:hypothetical protein